MSRRRFTWFNGVALAVGLAFLYVPLALVVAYSFNASRLVAVWGGVSTRWYGALLQNEPLKQAAWTSLRIAFLSSAVATLLGTAAAYTLVRHGRFRSRTLFTGMLYAPMVMPEVITGLSLLLLFVALGLERGFWTVTVAHTTLTLAFVAVVVQARLTDLDRSLEEAAADLGAPPLRAFLTVTLPLIAPAVAAGFLLAFTLSFDDLVLASFTSGPGSTTLPMLIYSSVRLGVTPEINAASTLMIGIVVLALVGTALLWRGPRKSPEP
jgi:putrescine transport system permease protein